MSLTQGHTTFQSHRWPYLTQHLPISHGQTGRCSAWHCPWPAFPFQVMLQKAAEELSFLYHLHLAGRSSQCFINHLSLLYHLLNWVRTTQTCCVRRLLLLMRGRARRGSPDPRHLSPALLQPSCINRSVIPARLCLLLLLPVFNNIINVWFRFLLNIGPESGAGVTSSQKNWNSLLRSTSFINLSWFAKLFDCTRSFHPPCWPGSW